MGVFSTIKENRTEGIIALIVLINLLLTNEFSKSFFPSFLTTASFNFIVLILLIVTNYYAQMKSNSQNRTSDKYLKEIYDKLELNLNDFELLRHKKLHQIKPLIDLINNNLISIKAVEQTIKGKNFITFFCYQEGFQRSLPSYMRDKSYQTPRRMYPKVLEQLGFLKLGKVNYGYFIISEENLYPSELRNVEVLSKYLVKAIKVSLDEEWKQILEDAKIKDLEFYNKNYIEKNPLNFNFLVSKIKAKDMVHEYLLKNDFDERFNSELATLAQIRQIFVNEKDKVKIKNFILGSSLNILIEDCPEHVKTKLNDLEPSFRKIGIKYIYDYHKVNKEDLIAVISTSFANQNEVTFLANKILTGSRNYEETLHELGIYLE